MFAAHGSGKKTQKNPLERLSSMLKGWEIKSPSKPPSPVVLAQKRGASPEGNNTRSRGCLGDRVMGINIAGNDKWMHLLV